MKRLGCSVPWPKPNTRSTCVCICVLCLQDMIESWSTCITNSTFSCLQLQMVLRTYSLHIVTAVHMQLLVKLNLTFFTTKEFEGIVVLCWRARCGGKEARMIHIEVLTESVESGIGDLEILKERIGEMTGRRWKWEIKETERRHEEKKEMIESRRKGKEGSRGGERGLLVFRAGAAYAKLFGFRVGAPQCAWRFSRIEYGLSPHLPVNLYSSLLCSPIQ